MAQVESEKGPRIKCLPVPAPFSDWWQQLSAMTNPPAIAVKMYLDGATHELPLVALGDPLESMVRFYDGAATKAFKLCYNIYILILDEEYQSDATHPTDQKIDEEYWSVPVPPDEEQKIDEEYISTVTHPTERLSTSVYVSSVALDP